MKICHANELPVRHLHHRIGTVLEAVNTARLRALVEHIAIPRHHEVEAAANRAMADWLVSEFTNYGYRVERQGPWCNVVAYPQDVAPKMWIGAHYDSVPGCPGADDNASAVATMLMCAQLTAAHMTDNGCGFVAFNREEDGLIGSEDFVSRLSDPMRAAIKAVHVLEMVGYRATTPGSQRCPSGLPIRIPDVGDFLGIVGNFGSREIVREVLTCASGCQLDIPVISLTAAPGVERLFPVIGRSDHAPFWRSQIRATMWTDTAEFRNPHYHRVTDTADTLDFDFMRSVCQLLCAVTLSELLEGSCDEDEAR